ncbi:MAG: TetR/AcrR family transcriptional regulator [Bacillaceae bacterium]|nr:TetR/AcrR family transcriptional regulator [Bacillaceae bacterium]
MPTALFYKLNIEKQNLIVKQSLSEFSRYGYDATSTNQIVKKTGISKGSLFKYFANKEDLFLFVCKKSTEELVRHIQPVDDPDFLSNIKQMLLQELDFYDRYPEVYQLFLKIQCDPNHPVYQRVIEDFEKVAEEIMEGVFQYLPDGDQSQQLTKTFVIWVLEGLKKEMLKKTQKNNQSINDIEHEIDQYLNVLKKCLG